MDATKLFRDIEEKETYQQGEAIFHRGDAGDSMYAVAAGSVQLIVDGQTIATIEPGGIFGEMALVDGSPRSADAVAASDAELVKVTEHRFRFMVHQQPIFALYVMRIMADRLRAMNPGSQPRQTTAR